MNILVLLVLFTSSLVEVTRAKGHNNCNDECLSKSYCLSSGGSNVCSKNSLVTAKWSVMLNNQGEDVLTLTLIGQNIGDDEEKTISVAIQKPLNSQNLSSNYFLHQTLYSCYKSEFRSTSSQVDIISDSGSSTTTSGSSYYSNNVLTCVWVLTKNDKTYPLYFESADLMTQTNYRVSIQYGDEKSIVANDTSEFPIYRMQYLKCCYKVHGNDSYMMVTNQTNEDQYLVQLLGWTSSTWADKLTVSLTDSKDTQLVFTCDLLRGQIKGIMNWSNVSTSISDHLYNTYVTYSRCSWSHPLVLSRSSSLYDTTDRVFDLLITADDVVVYSEKGIKLGNGTSKLLSPTNMIMILLVSLSMNWFM